VGDGATGARRYGDLALYRRLLREARPEWPSIGAMFVLSLLAMPIALLTPVPLMIAVDSAIGTEPLPGWAAAILPASTGGSQTAILAFAVALLLLVALLNQLQQLSTNMLGTYAGERLQLGFRGVLFRHVQRLSFAFHDRRGTADSVYRIQYDAPSIQWVAVHGVTPFLTAALTLAGMIYVTARIDWVLALVALAICPLLLLFTWASRQRLRAGWKEAKNLESDALSVVQEVLTGLRVVKAFGQEDREHARFLTRSGQGMRARVRLELVEAVFGVLVGMTLAVGTAIVLYVGVRHVQTGVLTLGDLLLVMGYLATLYVPLQTISKSIATLQSSLASAERAFTLLDEVPEVAEKPNARRLDRATGRVSFANVSFAYDGGPPVLDGVSFEVPPGSRVGFAGATGAGKTTLVSLLTRFYDPTGGAIRLDGVDLRDYDLGDLRNQFGIVLQEPVLFSTSIAENIAYARPEATREEIEEAARAANAHEFIAALPDGYDTVVGERGMRLSGGERQRVSIARAFLKDGPILILDEPTSSVDVRTEAGIIDAMERLMDGRTTFMIAHRLSTLASTDVLFEVEAGGITRLDDAVPVSGRSAP
jgi:ATP-binding cassette subfamily B protein